MSNNDPSGIPMFKDMSPIDLRPGAQEPVVEEAKVDDVTVGNDHGHGHRIQVAINPPPTDDRVSLVEETFGRQPYVTIREYYDQEANDIVHVINAGGGISSDPKAVGNLLAFISNILLNNAPDEESETPVA